MRRSLVILCLTALPASADPAPVAVFDMSFINFSQEVEYGARNEAEQARIALLSDHLRQRLKDSPRFALVDTRATAGAQRMHGEVFTCNACEARLARDAGAALSITGAVQKLSMLVQTVILRARDAQTGEILALYQTDIRGNTDIAWIRGLDFLIDNRLLAEHP